MSATQRLPPAEKRALTVGFMRLTDSAPLVFALETGLFARYGLDVELVREVSWANLRDKLVVGKLDAAHLLAPLPMMTSYGAGGIRANLLTGLALGANGNAITIARELYGSLDVDASAGAAAVARALGARLRDAPAPAALTFATVHLFSMHTFELRMWLGAAGLDPDRDARIIVLPPEQMCDSLRRGVIDGYCVGEPWNTRAVQEGIGAIAAAGRDIWNGAPEKVLGVTTTWHGRHPATHLRLRLALLESCRALDDAANRVAVAAMLARPEYLDLPIATLLPSLTGRLVHARDEASRCIPDFHEFARHQSAFPWRSHAAWMVRSSGVLLGKPIPDEQCQALVQQCYRPDLYREAARWLDLASPSRDERPEGEHALAWSLEAGVELGPDLLIEGQRFSRSAC
jgi:ABC-type nitrate/sulfonate/bicarbonate transport system substrate-binding protein